MTAINQIEKTDPCSIPIEQIDPSDGSLYPTGLAHEYFRRLRREDPVHWSPTGPAGPYWCITGFDDIVAVDSNHKVFSSEPSITLGEQPEEYRDISFISLDPPRHDIQRKAVQPGVSPKRLRELESLIRRRTGETLDALPFGETFDFVEHVAVDLTTKMLASFFDFPWEDRNLLPYWSDVISASEATASALLEPGERRRIMGECLAYFERLWRERAAAPPADDFLSLFAHNPATSDMPANPRELLGNLSTLVVGGNDTTRHSMTGGALFFDRNPTEWEKLRANPALVESAVSEIIRYQSPIAHMRRTARSDYELGGKLIRKGDRVVMWYLSGNRDETKFENPDEFIIDRPKRQEHISFGFGIHRCMGNRVAELQLRILLEELLTRVSRIEVMGEAVRNSGNMLQGYRSMPVRFHPRT